MSGGVGCLRTFTPRRRRRATDKRRPQELPQGVPDVVPFEPPPITPPPAFLPPGHARAKNQGSPKLPVARPAISHSYLVIFYCVLPLYYHLFYFLCEHLFDL